MRRVLRNPLRCNNRFAVLIVAALAAISTGAQADSSVIPGQNAASTEEVDWLGRYYSGQPGAAISHWRRTLPTLKSDLSTSTLIYLATSVAWYCALANDDECVIDTAVFASSIEDLDAIPDNERDAVYLNIGLLYGLSAAATGDSDLIKDFLNHGFFSTTEHLFFSPVLYIKRAFVAARLHLKVGDEIAANAALDRGLIALASIETARPLALDYAALTTQAIDLMHGLRRNADAFGLTISTRSAQNAILPAKSLERARQMFRETVVLFEAQFVEQSLALAEATLELLASFDIPQYNFAGERLELNVIRAAACASRPTGADCLNEALHAARQEMHFFDRSEEGQLPTYIEKYLATIEILTRSLVGDPFAEGFPGQTELRAVFASPFEPDEDLYLTAAQLLGRALISYWDGEPDSFEMTVRALKYIFDAQEWQNRRFIGSSLTPALSSRLVVLLAAAMLTHNRTANAEEASLVLQAVELVTRSARFKDSDALADLASAITATDRGATHALLRTRSREAYRRNSLIVDKLTEVIDAGLEPSRLAAVDFDLHRGLAELANRNTSLETYLDDGPQLSGISFFPTAEDVQAHLSEGEVLLFLAPSLGPLMISICVTPRTVSAVSFSVDKATMLADLRLLGAALTSTHSPSIALDTQYPVNAARRVYQAILGNRAAGPYKCIEKGDTVFLAPPDAFGGVPLEVTLAEEPQRDDVGWILGTATWAFQNNDFVYIPSVRAFVALRQLQRRASPRSNDVLSVGDPRLYDSGQASENYLSAITRGLPSGTKAGALRALRELPNTADEASQVYQLLGGSGRLLIGGAATERTLRSDFLSGYRYIHFATHGLVREEIPGLQEAALVLTPGSTNDTFDDGLLTASEIADLSLNADVAVLSACNTANFDLAFFQSETQGLTTAFAIAGVPATVVTLWPVETFSSERIVTSFFQQFNEGTVRASRALSIARGAILTTENRAFHHPRFWGAFVIYGDVISGPASPVDGTDRVYTLAGYGGVRGVLPGLGPSETLIYWGPYRDDGPLSHVTKVDQLLDVVWQVDRSSFGRSQMLKGDDERLYVLGYELRGNLPYPAAFTVDGRSGEELAFRKLGEPDEPGFIVGYVLTASDNLFLMTAQAKDPYGRDSEESKATYALHVLDQNLDTVKTERMPFDFRGGMPLNSGLAASDEYLLVFAQEPESYELPQPRIGRFGAFESCPTQRDTHVIWISRDDDESPLLEIANGIDIRRVIFSQEDGFVFVGTEDFECSFDKRMVVGRLMPGTGEWERIWTDPGPFGSTPAAIAEGAMGDLVIASSRRRTLDGRFGLSPPEESVFNPASGAPIGGMGSVSEGRVTWLKATGEIVEDRVFSAGLEVFIDGLSVTDQEVLIGGEVGAVPFVLSTPHPTTDAGATTH